MLNMGVHSLFKYFTQGDVIEDRIIIGRRIATLELFYNSSQPTGIIRLFPQDSNRRQPERVVQRRQR